MHEFHKFNWSRYRSGNKIAKPTKIHKVVRKGLCNVIGLWIRGGGFMKVADVRTYSCA